MSQLGSVLSQLLQLKLQTEVWGKTLQSLGDFLEKIVKYIKFRTFLEPFEKTKYRSQDLNIS